MNKKIVKQLDELIVRHYTKELEEEKDKTVYDLFNWKKVVVKLTDYKTGKELFNQEDLEFPEGYSQTACDIIATKYFRQAGVPETGKEKSMKQVAHRLVSFWVNSCLDEGLINEEQKDILYDELVYMFLSQMFAPNSPQWFNTGLKLAYGIDKEAEGNYYYSLKEKRVVPSEDAYSRTSASACFILSIKDALLGEHSITDQIVTETLLFKQGAGTGSNFSSIRGAGEKLSGGGTSSGLMSFLRVFDRNAGAIKSGGTTRRAAKIVSLDADHPEILDFINWKAREEQKVRDLVKMGYSSDFNGEAYDTVSGQNSNNSVRFSNDFMKKVCGEDDNTEWTLKGRVDERADRTIDCFDLWDSFNKSAWECADPAPQFHDTANEWHTCPAGEDGELWARQNKINASNPCSEYFFLDDTACNLASINVMKFYDTNNFKFDLKGFLHCIGLCEIVLEASIHMGQFPTKDVARKSHLFRTTGLGLANTASLNMAMACPYDSDEARTLTSTLAGIMTGYAYHVSSLMADKVGAFEMYELNKPYMQRVLRNHARVAGANLKREEYEGLSYTPVEVDHSILTDTLKMKELSTALVEIWEEVSKPEKQFRNAQVSVIAPTGTISLAMDCAATSVEPFFAHMVYKKLVGGGYIQLVNPMVSVGLKKLGYPEHEITAILEYMKEHGGSIDNAPYIKEEHLSVFDTANKCGDGNRYISPMGHVKMVAAITPLISGAISKTVNLPSTATVEDFKEVHISAWKLGVKCIALYRDGSKASQPLNSTTGTEDNSLENKTYPELLEYAKELSSKQCKNTRNRPEGIRYSRTHEAKIEDLKVYVNITFYPDGNIAEIYLDSDREGTLVKGMLASLSKMVSKMLQYNVPAEEISRSLRGQKYEPHGFVSGHPYIKIADSISDLLSKIIDIELGDFSCCQVKPQPNEFLTQKELLNKLAGLPVEEVAVPDTQEEAKHNVDLKEQVKEKHSAKGTRVYGKTCSNCHSKNMAKNGTCYVCLDCGTTTGCS